MDQLLVALDVESGARALQLADQLRGVVGGYKIGKRLFTLEGPAIVRSLTERGDRVFLDMKFHDIPNTVATAVAAATSLGVWMVNVHASGGRRMMEAARDAAAETAARENRAAPLVIGVTVLTSMNAEALAEIGVDGSGAGPGAETGDAGAGVRVWTASSHRRSRRGRSARHAVQSFAIVTPGIRGGAATVTGKDDQERTMSAPEAIAAGASYIVVGRPIIAAEDPRAAAQRIAEARTAD